MKIIKPYTEILTDVKGKEILKNIEKVARTCYKSEHLISDGTAEKLVRMLIKRGHEAMIEHESISVKFVVDRGVSHEIVRHRMASYAQESTRYCNYANDKFGNELTFIIPNDIAKDEKNLWHWVEVVKSAETHYLSLIAVGTKPEIARSLLPNALKTEIVMTANLREWRHFFKLRCDKAAHPQMREVAVPLLNKFKDLIPVVFDDLEF